MTDANTFLVAQAVRVANDASTNIVQDHVWCIEPSIQGTSITTVRANLADRKAAFMSTDKPPTIVHCVSLSSLSTMAPLKHGNL